jgi:hypothetical protein
MKHILILITLLLAPLAGFSAAELTSAATDRFSWQICAKHDRHETT